MNNPSRLLFLVLTLSALPVDLPAHETRNTLVPQGYVHYAPGPIPDRVALVLTADPARSQTVTWRTNAGVTRAVAQLNKALPGPGLHLGARDIDGRTRPLETENGVAHHHAVTFTGLEPDTLYAYRVRGADTWSEWFQFRTAKSSAAPFSFLYFGDAQNSIRSHFSRVIREAFAAHERPALLLHAGDLVNSRSGVHDDEWGEWFDAGGFLHGMVPSFPVAGNHEFIRRDVFGPRVLSPHWTAHFSVPANGPEGLRDTVYYVEYQGVLLVALDSMNALQDEALAKQQAEWLDRLLSASAHDWVIVSHHHPVHSVSLGRDNPLLREHWQPLYEKHGVDLVLQGHDHAYGRGANLAEGTTAIDDDAGTVYVVSVAGPKMYLVAEEAESSMARVGEEVQLYQVIQIEADRLRYASRTVTGEVYDAFELRMTEEGKHLVDLVPADAPRSTCGNPDRPRPDRCWNGVELVD
ncbi:metallophosphoesterase family protein [Wenzhouxiangella sp. XN24]|uniref:purple acid phosphatase family protein n=1 Tax=Wenzhouxiangella sp. XN24 TaxID=2713569 RepID=UPI0013EACF53|nr:metallophosphoesterase family protein [Wenzhouxiangella sp. XN24]NGX17339.1 metallophosphoesterase family protein [Wenzhouxiangella sp. XN24]